ncbi:MAG: DUF4918 family protein [Cytophagales bacterium]|jgi:hypothetical protein|nr:DUF4918 family protein [Cytophagales bacterium]
MFFSDRAVDFYTNLQPPASLPGGVSVMNPYENPETQRTVREFYQKFFADNEPRVPLLGINPGRFGGGVTGVSFTDPLRLREKCGIDHALTGQSELSSQFVYAVVDAMGGAAAFYRRFYLGALYPLALVKDGKNFNYYDDPAVYAALKPDILASLRAQSGFGLSRTAVCLGQKNETYFRKLNDEAGLFDRILTLEHPRFVMQYRRKQLDDYVEKYVKSLPQPPPKEGA